MNVELDVDLSTGVQAQGPIVVIPVSMVGRDVTVDRKQKAHKVPDDGLELIATRGYAHRLLSTTATWTAGARDVEHLALGILEVSARAYLVHPDHEPIGIGPGRYVFRRQRELGARSTRGR